MTKIVPARSKTAVEEAVAMLRKGGVIIYPSESSYGIGCDAVNNKAVKAIVKLKKRPIAKQMIAYVLNKKMAEEYCGKEISEKEGMLLTKFPGKLTLVKHKKSFRKPTHPFALSLLRKFKKPIITTSANLSGKAPIYKIAEIKKLFDGKVDLIIDTGNLPKNMPSTIFNLDNKKILRRGPISEKQICGVLGI